MEEDGPLPGWMEDESSPAPAKPSAPLMSRKEAVLHGAVESIPFGQKLVATGSTGVQSLLKALADRGLAPAYMQQLKPTTVSGEIDAERARLAQAEAERPEYATGGKIGGAVLSTVAMSPLKMVQGADKASRALRVTAAAGNAGLYGLAHGAGQGDTLAESAEGALKEGALNFVLGGAGQGLFGEALPAAARFGGEKVKDVAGWLKTHSLRPTPTLGEAMANIPGGTVGVGRELLERNVGGVTKGQALRRASAAKSKAGAAIDDVATTYDQAGGAPVLIDDALDAAAEKAARLAARPPTKAAGEKLGALLEEYRNLYPRGRPISATEALTLKRELRDAVYGANDAFNKAGNKLEGDYAKGLSQFEREVDGVLDKALGPAFEKANVSFRRLGSATEAAERQAARGVANNIVPLVASAVGLGGTAAGYEDSIPLAAGAMLLGKYGAPVGARLLHGTGNAMSRGLPAMLERAPAAMSRRVTPAAAASTGLGGTLQPMYGEGPRQDPEEAKRRALVQALMGAP